MGFGAFDFWAGEAGGDVAGVDGGDKARFAEVVLRLQVLDFGAVGAVDDADGDGEDGVALCLIRCVFCCERKGGLIPLHPP